MEGNGSAIITSITTAATNLASEMTGLIEDLGPIVLGVIVAVLTITLGIRLFKKLTGKAN